MYNQVYLTLLTNNGSEITEFTKDGLTFVEGRKGSEYKIKVYNPTSSKIKVILSVDGIDIISGKRADQSSQWYVINAYSTQIIDGWRINNDQVRKFFFNAAKGSYNAKTGNDTRNLGVIGLMAFKEKVYVPTVLWNYIPNGHYYSGYYGGTTTFGLSDSYSSGIVNCSGAIGSTQTATEVKTSMNLSNGTTLCAATVGTGMGKKKESKVQTVNMEFESSPFVTLALYYKTRKELEALGIVVAPVKSTTLPSPFAGYCKQV